MKLMNILYIITQADGGGAQNYTLTLAKKFGGKLAAGAEDTKVFHLAHDAGVETFPLRHLRRPINPFHDLLAVWEIRQLIKNLDPDLIHLNSSKAGILGSFAAMGLKKKVVFTAHGFVFNEPLPAATRAFYLALEKTASSYRDFIIAVSDADKQAALDNNLIAPNKLQTIHNGIESINFLSKEQARSALNLSRDKIIIGTIANFYKTKGLDVLIKAIAMLADDLKNKISVALIGGDGPEKANIKSKISNLKLSHTIKLLGRLEGAQKYLHAFDVFVLPSRKEGLPYTLLEAMQAGLPIVASQVGGIPEALGDAGFLVKPDDPKELAEVLGKIISDINQHGPQYFNQLGRQAKERAALFTQEKMLAQTLAVYTQLLK